MAGGSRPHRFEWSGGRWRCVRCLRSKTSPKSNLDKLPCGVLPPALNVLFNGETDHNLWATQVLGGDSTLLIFCWRCGYYAQSCPVLLAKPCCGAPKSKGAIARRNRFLKCIHPRLGNVRLAVPWRYCPRSNENTLPSVPPSRSVRSCGRTTSPLGAPRGGGGQRCGPWVGGGVGRGQPRRGRGGRLWFRFLYGSRIGALRGDREGKT
jgi:hypothetical protein